MGLWVVRMVRMHAGRQDQENLCCEGERGGERERGRERGRERDCVCVCKQHEATQKSREP